MEERELRNLTDQYWEEGWDTDKYIKKLLPREMGYLEHHNRIKTSHTEILVQLVGFSWEPLLISLCAYEPKILVLVLNKFYNEQEGAARGDKFKELIKKLKEKNLIDILPEYRPDPLVVIEDKPASVFKFLRKTVLGYVNEGKQVVIDITGAKKNMVSGAYLFASYTNSTVSYVDFKEYSEKYGKPYGYMCLIDKPENPMELFKIREWSRVEEQYKQYAFESALRIIEEIEGKTKEFIEADESAAIEKLKECLRFYEIWDNGDYRGALEKYRKLKNNIDIACPLAVEELGVNWYFKKNIKKTIGRLEGLGGIEQSIYLKDGSIIIYAQDELKKIKRLIEHKEDYRSALLRAAGLSDFLLKARLIKLWMKDQLVIEMDGLCLARKDFDDKELRDKIDKTLLEFSGIAYIIKALRWKPSKRDYVLKFKIFDKNVTAHSSGKSPKLEKFWRGIDSKTALPDDIFKLRNKAIHFCLSVPREIAKVAVELAEKNLEEFISEWSTEAAVDGIYEAIDWHDLCEQCGIEFLPKLGVMKNE